MRRWIYIERKKDRYHIVSYCVDIWWSAWRQEWSYQTRAWPVGECPKPPEAAQVKTSEVTAGHQQIAGWDRAPLKRPWKTLEDLGRPWKTLEDSKTPNLHQYTWSILGQYSRTLQNVIDLFRTRSRQSKITQTSTKAAARLYFVWNCSVPLYVPSW